MRILLDTEFPSSTEYEAPPEVELIRHSGQQIEDGVLVDKAVDYKVQAIAVLSHKSLHQTILREKCHEYAITLIVVDTPDPLEAKIRFLHHIHKIRSELSANSSSILLVLKSEIRSIDKTSLV